MSYDREAANAILGEALFYTISYSVDNQPFAIPTAFVRKEGEALPIWSGLIPIPSKRLAPIADELSKNIPLPEHLK